MNGCAVCARNIAEREELAERVRQLEELLHDDSWVPAEWRLTGKEIVMLNVLAKRRVATRDAFMTALYGTDPDGGAQEKIVDVWLSHMRGKLRRHGIVILTVRGQGYQLDDASRALLKQQRKAVA